MKTTTSPISFAGSQLNESRHVCAFFHSADEEYRVLLPFIKEGFECGDKVVHVVSPSRRSDHLKRLAAAGIDTTAAEQLDPTVPMTPRLIMNRVHPEDIPLVDEVINRARSTGGDFEYEHRLLMPDHSIKYLHVIAHETRGQDGEMEYIGAVQDVTERRLSEEALGRLRSELAHVSRVATLGALTASIAHEVSQPLAGISPRLLARGAVECLFKPFSEAALLDALNAALRAG